MKKGGVIMKIEEEKKIFNPRIEMFSAFKKPFATPSKDVVSVELSKATACCACTACR
ncbi:MAG: hypothetical protein ABIA02_00070 [Candidatus Falkowbacteria bacterium]